MSTAFSIIAVLRTEIRHIKKTIADFGRRLDKHEDTLITVIGQVQRVMGCLDGQTSEAPLEDC